MKKVILLSILFLQISAAFAQESVWQLPLEVTDKNTKVNFDVDTTWHVVHGKLSKITGDIALSDPKNLLSVASEIHFPVKSIDTGWGLRNDSLFDHWEADKFPEAILKTTGIEGNCTPETVSEKACAAKLKGTLTIRDITKDILIDLLIEKKDGSYKAHGSYSFAWADYGIKDPSMIAANVDPIVKVKYSTTIPAKQ